MCHPVRLLGPGELLSSLVCHPEYKLLNVLNIPHMAQTSLAYSAYTWPGLLKHLRQMLIANARMEEGEHITSERVCVKGFPLINISSHCVF